MINHNVRDHTNGNSKVGYWGYILGVFILKSILGVIASVLLWISAIAVKDNYSGTYTNRWFEWMITYLVVIGFIFASGFYLIDYFVTDYTYTFLIILLLPAYCNLDWELFKYPFTTKMGQFKEVKYKKKKK